MGRSMLKNGAWANKIFIAPQVVIGRAFSPHALLGRCPGFALAEMGPRRWLRPFAGHIRDGASLTLNQVSFISPARQSQHQGR